MSDKPPPNHRERRAVRHLLDAIDRVLCAAREVESARAALLHEAEKPKLRLVSEEQEKP
jgi:hypothetical protein